MDYITSIEFIIFSEFGGAETATATFTNIYDGKVSRKETNTSYSTLKFKPRTLNFSLKADDSFFVSFTNTENYIKEINRYYIKAYDQDDNLFFRGLIGRNDFSVNDQENIISINAKDLTVLYSFIKNTVITPVEVLDNDLENIADLYGYYLDLGLQYYFGSSFVTTSYKSLAYDTELLELSSVEYDSKDISIQKMINGFFSTNSHIIRYNETTNKIIIDDSNRLNFDVASKAIDDNDIFDYKESNIKVGKFDNEDFASILNSESEYSSEKAAILLKNDAKYNQFISAINKKINLKVGRKVNSYSLSMNQIIKVFENSYSIKELNEKSNYYDLGLLNARNPITNSTIWVATNKFDYISGGKPTNNEIWVATEEFENIPNNNEIWIALEELETNPTNNDIWIGSEKLGE